MNAVHAHAQTRGPQAASPARAPGRGAPAAIPGVGNQILQQYLRGGAIRAKLAVGSADDPAETEADRIAQQITSPVAAPCACGGTCASCRGGAAVIRRKETDGSAAPRARSDAFGQSSGRPLSSGLRRYFEPRLGIPLDAVRVHDGPEAAATAEAIRAQAYTAGNDIGFAAGQFAPETQRGRRLLAHELAHVAQQSAVVRRYSLDDFTKDVDDTAASVKNKAENAVGTVAETVGDVTQSVSDTASGVYDDARKVAGGIVDDAKKTVDNAEEGIATAAASVGNFALDEANAFAKLFGGSVRIVGTALIIELPAIPLFKNWSDTLSVLEIGRFIPLLPAGFAVGPLAVEGAIGVRLGNPTMNAGLGPAWLRNVVITLDPLKGTASGAGEIYVGGAVSESVEAALEAAVAAEGILPTDPPIPILGSVEAGGRVILRGVGKGATQDRVIVSYSHGTIAVDANLSLKLGVVIELDTELFLDAEVEGKDICNLIWPISTYRIAERAEQFTLPVKIAYSGGLPRISLGTPDVKPIPVDSIQTYLRNNRPPDRCLGLEEIIEHLCKQGKLPPSVCSMLTGKLDIPGVIPSAQPVAPLGPATPGTGPVTPTAPAHKAPIGTKSDPIHMIWLKPLRFYDNPLRLDGGTYSRNKKKRLTNGDTIGVDFWPGVGDVVKKNLNGRGREADRFKKALENDGYENWDQNSPDHVLDLFFDGADDFDNLWPLDRDVNRRAGTWHPGQPVEFNKPSDPPDAPPRREAIASSTLDGCYFIIKKVTEPP